MNNLKCPNDADLMRLATAGADTVELDDHVKDCTSCRGRLDETIRSLKALRGVDIAPKDDWAGVQADTPDKASQRPVSQAPESDDPESIGEYKVSGRLGKPGGQADVFRVTHPRLPKTVAIKWNRQPVPPASDLDRLKIEADLLATLDHPGLVRVHDVDVAEDRLFLVMEHVLGRDLAQKAKQVRYTPREAAGLVAELAGTVEYIHGNGVIHQDLKPQNVMIEPDGRTRLIDFGLARLKDYWSEDEEPDGTIRGTPEYMAPEQVRGEDDRIGEGTDIWALGVIFYELLTGTRPFNGDTRSNLFDEIEHTDPRTPRQINAAIPPELERITLKCLQKDVTARYSSAGNLVDELDRWLGRARRWAYLAVGVSAFVLVVVLTLAGNYFFAPPESAPIPLEGSLRLSTMGADELDAYKAGNTSVDEVAIQEYTTFSSSRVPSVQTRDGVQVKATLNRACYLYLLWIDSEGQVIPIYPWTDGQWQGSLDSHEPSTKVSFPDETSFIRMQGSKGVETLVLLASDTALPPDVDLNKALRGLSPQSFPRERGPDFGSEVVGVGVIDDSKRRQELRQRLSQHFELIRSISFANLGDITLPDSASPAAHPDEEP